MLAIEDSNNALLIGIDHGYAAMKTVRFSFPTGLVEYSHEPYTSQNVLKYRSEEHTSELQSLYS